MPQNTSPLGNKNFSKTNSRPHAILSSVQIALEFHEAIESELLARQIKLNRARTFPVLDQLMTKLGARN